jgi:hypothetical protein
VTRTMVGLKSAYLSTRDWVSGSPVKQSRLQRATWSQKCGAEVPSWHDLDNTLKQSWFKVYFSEKVNHPLRRAV